MKNVSVLAACVALGACATTQNISASPETVQDMKGKSLVVIHRESPDFIAMTSGKGMFAVAGVGAAVVEGNKLVEEAGLLDPAMTIGHSLARDLVVNYGLTFNGETGKANSGNVATLVNLASGSDYALDVATNGWSYIYDGFAFGDYFVGYSSELRLIDVATGKVVSSGTCAYDAKKAGKSAVSHDALVANDAFFVKQELADAIDLCAQEFALSLFPEGTVASSSR